MRRAGPARPVPAAPGAGPRPACTRDGVAERDSPGTPRRWRGTGSCCWIAGQEPPRPPGWLIGDPAGTDAEMFALPAGAWAGEPGSRAHFPAIRAPALIICGENEEPPAAGHRPPAMRSSRHHRRGRNAPRAVASAAGTGFGAEPRKNQDHPARTGPGACPGPGPSPTPRTPATQLRAAIHPALASAWPAGLRLAAWRQDLVQLVHQAAEVPSAERRPGAVAGNQARRQSDTPRCSPPLFTAGSSAPASPRSQPGSAAAAPPEGDRRACCPCRPCAMRSTRRRRDHPRGARRADRRTAAGTWRPGRWLVSQEWLRCSLCRCRRRCSGRRRPLTSALLPRHHE